MILLMLSVVLKGLRGGNRVTIRDTPMEKGIGGKEKRVGGGVDWE